MPTFAYTPYDGSKQPFTIGLAPLDLATWIDPDERLGAYLSYKERLFAERRDTVFSAEAETEASQAEILAAIVEDLTERHQAFYTRTGEGVLVRPTGATVLLDGPDPALMTAARLVEEDLVIMRRSDRGWRLVAAALCFPSSWSLKDKAGLTMDEIHAPVPGYTAMAARMNRIFDSLRVEIPVWRLNWSLYPDDDLHHPESKQLPRDWFGRPDSAAFVRVERQTLRKMPVSGDILFTIKVMVDPVEAFAGHPDGARLAAGLRDQLLALDADQLAYKSLTHHRDLLADRLAALEHSPTKLNDLVDGRMLHTIVS